MSPLPPVTVTPQDLAQWYQTKKQLDALKASEMLLRQRIFAHYFPAPKEGTNTYVLPDSFQLKGTHTINRKIVEEAMQALCSRPSVPVGDGTFTVGKSKLEEAGVRVDLLIKWKPELSIGVYRELTESQRHLVDQMLLIDNGSPQLKIDPPAKPRGKAAAKAQPDDVQEDKGPQA